MASSPTFVNINKIITLGGSAIPLTSVLLSPPIPKLLSELRTYLTSAGWLTSTNQLFLNDGGFPVPLNTEARVSWLDLTADGKKPLGIYFPPVVATPAPSPQSPLAQPTLPDPHKFDPLPVVPDIPIPQAGTIAPATAHTGGIVNARTLSEAQLAEVVSVIVSHAHYFF